MVSPFKHPFWYAFECYGPAPKCKDELLIIDISKSIRAKVDWKIKFKDNEIVSKWKNEIKQQVTGKTDYADDVINFVFEELKWFQKLETSFDGFTEAGFSVIGDEGTVISDSAVSEGARTKMVEENKKLYAMFGDDLDYHPHTHNQVIDLVHPSLFPVQYNKTPVKVSDEYRVAKFDDSTSNVKKGVADFGISKAFQWLPSLMKYNNELKKYEFKSYINNLNPNEFAELYDIISDVFTSAAPGLNLCLARAASEDYLRIDIPSFDEVYEEDYKEKYEALFDEYMDSDDYGKLEELEKHKGDYVKKFKPKYNGHPKTTDFDLRKFDNLKVIVKLADIQLNPENPTYEGGTWHVEGTINEDIIATVIYYYDVENIKDSKLSFRRPFEDPEYEQGDSFYCTHFYGLNDSDDMFQNMGSIDAKTNRVVIFPNTLQHHVDPFELIDKTKNGYRKILCFFLVDPYNENVIASDKVPPQQKQWWENKNTKQMVPEEVRDNFRPQDLNEAKEIRLQLMSERSLPYSEGKEDGVSSFARTFSLCEH